jgi:WD40 repeat protein
VGTWNDRHEPVVELWDLPADKPAKARTHPTGNHSLAFSPDGKLLASFDSAGSVRIIDWASGQHLHEFEVAPLREAWAGVVEFSPDGRLLAIGEDFGLLRLLDLQTWTFTTNQTKGAEALGSLAFSPASDLLAAGLGYGEGTIGLWDTRSGEPLGELTNHTDFVTALAFTTDGRELLSASSDGTIRVWSVADRVERRRLQSTGEEFIALALLPDSRTLVSGGGEGLSLFLGRSRHEPSAQPHEPGTLGGIRVSAWAQTPRLRVRDPRSAGRAAARPDLYGRLQQLHRDR